MKKKGQMTELARIEEKNAFKLLIPTALILLIVAVYPLSQVFYYSFTNKIFAGTEKISFIGFDNYKELLSVVVRELPPVTDEDTGEPKIDPDTNKIVYTHPIDVLPMRPFRYRELFQFKLFGNKYVVAAANKDFLIAVYNTIIFTFFSVLLETFLGLIIALVVNSKFKGRGMMRAIMLIPWAVITVVSARMWEWMLQPTRIGLFNTIFDKLGIADGHIAFLSIDKFQLPALIAADVWKTTPFMALLMLAGLQMIPYSLYEAAWVDGASRLRQLLSITLPLLKPTIAVALVFRTLDALRVFGLFQVMLANKKYSMASYNYYQLVSNREMGLASSIGVIIFILISIFAAYYIKMLGVDTE